VVALASYADALWARHAIFLPMGKEDYVTSPKNVCAGGGGNKMGETVGEQGTGGKRWTYTPGKGKIPT